MEGREEGEGRIQRQRETLAWEFESSTLHLPPGCLEVANYVAKGIPGRTGHGVVTQVPGTQRCLVTTCNSPLLAVFPAPIDLQGT